MPVSKKNKKIAEALSVLVDLGMPRAQQNDRSAFQHCKAGLVFVSAFPNRKTFTKYLETISWETEVWIADNPTHLIHFNGARFLGPYGDI